MKKQLKFKIKRNLEKTKSDTFYNYFQDWFNDEMTQFLEKGKYLDKSDGPTKSILYYIKF